MPKQQELDDFALTARQALFIAEYLKDFNATQAAIRAGYSKRRLDAGSELLTNT
jgi:phage terminase small subunit